MGSTRKHYQPLDLSRVQTYPLGQRPDKVEAGAFGLPLQQGASFQRFVESLPRILAGKEIREVALAIVGAHQAGKPVLVAMGAHVIKCGLSPLFVQLMEEGIITALALNGAGVIHDVEVALKGSTSEDVVAGLETGRFGMVRETGELINRAVAEGVSPSRGIGLAVGERLNQLAPPFRNSSLLARGADIGIPVTVHVAIGTDIIHTHPSMDGAKWGEGSLVDLRLLAAVMAELGDGGVILNVGSAVILPEVILKAYNIVRNLGFQVRDFVAADFDFIRQYRSQSLVARMAATGGRGYTITGHHELTLPLLFQLVVEELGERALPGG